MPGDRPYDIVLFGATGFTGGLTAEYLARHAPGRAALGAGRPQPGEAGGRPGPARRHRPGAGRAAAAHRRRHRRRRRCARSPRAPGWWPRTVGPYVHHGEPLVAACAAAGTDYLDITGEPEFVDLMYVRHHAEAVRTGARLVHACGFDSIPHDLGVWFTVQQLPAGRADHRGRVRPRRRHGSPPAPTTRRSPRSPVPRQATPGRPGAPGGRAATGRPAGPRGARPAGPLGGAGHVGGAAADHRPAGGPPLGRAPARSTARTSATGTSPPSSGCRRCWPAGAGVGRRWSGW